MSDMGLGTKVVGTSAAANLNQAQNTVLFTYVAPKPCTIVRYGAIAVTGGILAAGNLKLRKNTLGVPGTFADIAGSATGTGHVRAIGQGIAKRVGAQVPEEGYSRYTLNAGESVVIASEAAAGGTSTAQLFIEVVEHPFAGAQVAHIRDV